MNYITRKFLTVCCLLYTLCISAQNRPYFNSDPEMDCFVDSLLSVMTLDEKIGQTVLYTSGWDVITGPVVDANYQDYIKAGMVGAIFNAKKADYIRSVQKIAVEQTRLGIPLLFGFDIIHGHRTIFPISLGEAASWDLQAIETSARVAAAEASAEGLNWTFAPMVDIARDPRWGRISEGAGEDTYYACKVAEARVRGFQGKDLKDVNSIMACMKHYAAYGAAQAGRDYHTVDISENELRYTYLPPFKAALDAGVATVMTSFNELFGVPASASKFLLRKILRDEWGFDGFVVTDYTSINEMIPHGYARDEKHSAELSMNAGVDMDMQGGVFRLYLHQLVAEGKVSEKTITDAARRILEMKYRLGLFEDPYRYCDAQREKETVMCQAHLDAARDVARKSMVLLKNDHQTLPLSKSKKIALIGPLANDKFHIIGSWAGEGDRTEKPVTVLEGLQQKLGNKASVTYVKGCDIDSEDRSGFDAAVRAVKDADVAVLVMGEAEGMSGEASSRTNLDLPGVQKALLAEIKKTGKPTVLVLMNGRPLTLNWEQENMDAILETWFPGTMGGIAIADVLLGDYNPSGKLPVTFPRNVGQIPLFYNMKNTGRPYDPAIKDDYFKSRYLDSPNTPLYPFGYGLSYTTFEYSGLEMSSGELTALTPLKITVTVKNTGKYDGEEVVQLYIRDLVGNVTRPVKELKGFEKIALKAGEQKKVSFLLTVDDLRFYDQEMNFIYEPGDFHLFVGGNSEETLKSGFKILW